MSTLLLVTGASAGIGRAIVESAPPDTRVVDVSRSGAGVADRHVAADLADASSWAEVGAALATEIVAFTGERVTFVHAAGTLEPIGFAGEVAGAAYTRNVLLNAASGQVLGHAVLTALGTHAAPRRELVLLSSGAASKSYAGWSAYGAGKAALESWARTVGEEQRHRGGVTVCAIAPGVVATGMQAAIRDTPSRDFPQVDRFRDLHADGALRDPGEVAVQLWQTLDAGVETGSVLDLRHL